MILLSLQQFIELKGLSVGGSVFLCSLPEHRTSFFSMHIHYNFITFTAEMFVLTAQSYLIKITRIQYFSAFPVNPELLF